LVLLMKIILLLFLSLFLITFIIIILLQNGIVSVSKGQVFIIGLTIGKIIPINLNFLIYQRIFIITKV